MCTAVLSGPRIDCECNLQDAVLQGLARQEKAEADLRKIIAVRCCCAKACISACWSTLWLLSLQDLPQDTQDVLAQSPTEVVQHLKNTLQHLICAAQKAHEPLFSYKVSSSSQPAAQTLLKIAAGLCHSGALQTGILYTAVTSLLLIC